MADTASALLLADCVGTGSILVVFALGYEDRELGSMNGISDEDLRWLLELVEQEELAEIEVRVGQSQVIVGSSATSGSSSSRFPASRDQPRYGSELDEHHIPVLSPLAGIFYRGSSPEADPFVAPGDEVVYGDSVGLIEAMKLFNEVPAPATGVIGNVLAKNGQQVAADEVLMIIET